MLSYNDREEIIILPRQANSYFKLAIWKLESHHYQIGYFNFAGENEFSKGEGILDLCYTLRACHINV